MGGDGRAPKTSPLVGRKALVGAPIEPTEPASPLFSERGVTPPWVDHTAPPPAAPAAPYSRHEVVTLVAAEREFRATRETWTLFPDSVLATTVGLHDAARDGDVVDAFLAVPR